LIGLAVLIGMLYYGKLFFVTVISALIISFILEPFVQSFMRLRLPRGPASFVACSLALLALYFGSLGAYTQISGLIQDLPSYVQRINDIGQSVVGKIESVEGTLNQLLPKRMQEQRAAASQQAPPPIAPSKRRRTPEPQAPLTPTIQEVRITPEQPSVVNWLYGQVGQISEMVLAASFVPFLVYFMLSWRDHIRRSFLQLFDGENRGEVSRSLRGVAELSRAYIAGNFVLGIVLSVVTTGLFLFFRLPYALLVGPISGFLSLVPYVGLPLAVLPPALAALPVYTRLPQYLLLGTAVALLHLIAMNLLYPKVVGARVHLNPLAVTIALMFWGLLWGGAGLALAIPITAGIKAVCDNVSGLEPYGRLLGD
jgi:predicted PurR-regulated permease PerM